MFEYTRILIAFFFCFERVFVLHSSLAFFVWCEMVQLHFHHLFMITILIYRVYNRSISLLNRNVHFLAGKPLRVLPFVSYFDDSFHMLQMSSLIHTSCCNFKILIQWLKKSTVLPFDNFIMFWFVCDLFSEIHNNPKYVLGHKFGLLLCSFILSIGHYLSPLNWWNSS